MAGILDFFSPESGQRRRAALDQLGRSAEYYVPPELRQLLGFAAEMTPTATIDRAAAAGGRMMAPDRTPMQRVGDLGGMLSETAGVVAPMAVAGRAGMPVAQAVQEGLLGFSMGADDVGRKFVERMNQPGPVPTMYSNPLGGAKPKSITAYHGGTGSVADAAGGRGAWFSEAKDLADEYAFGGGSVNQFSISPQRPIEFLHAEQRRPIGDLISTAVENAGDLSDETISAARGKISALQKRYGEEKRPLFEYWNKDPDIADLFRTLGYDSISVAEKSGGPQTWAALTPDIISPSTTPRTLNPAEQMAKDILGMRAAGRAGEVTEEMMAQADPQYMFFNTPLPMDYESRMARAGEIEADHGTTASFPAFDNRAYAASGFGTHMGAKEAADSILKAKRSPYSPAHAPTYVEGSQVLPLRVNAGPMLRVEDTETWNPGATQYAMAWSDDPASVAAYNAIEKNPDYPKFGNDAEQAAFMQNYLKKSGFGGFVYDNKFEGGGDSYAVLDPANIRSRFARFDPEFRHLRNLSAGVGGLGLLSTMLPQEEQY